MAKKHNVKLKNLTSKTLKRVSKLSKTKLAVFALAFGVIGIIIARSLAANAVNSVTLDGDTASGNGNTRGCQSGQIPHFNNGILYINNNKPVFDIYADGGLASYTWTLDGVAQGSVNGDGWAVACPMTTSPLADGTHSFTATETRPNPGNMTTPNPFNFIVDTIPPTASSAPALASYGDSGVVGDNITRFKNIPMTGTTAYEPYKTMTVLANGTSAAAGAAVNSAGTWAATTSPWSDGSTSFNTYTTDGAGNNSPSSPSTTIILDSVAPTGSITSPSNGATVSGTVPITATAADNSGGTGIWKVVFQIDGVTKSTVTSAPYTFNWNSTSVANGSHTINAVISDTAGNTLTPTESVTVSNGAGATAPSAPTLNSATSGNASTTLSWSAPTSDGGSAITNYKVYRGTTSGTEALLTTGSCSSLSNVLTCTDAGLTNGVTYFYQISAFNSAGEGSRSGERSATPATTPSAPTLNSPTPGNTTVSLSWSAPSSNGGSVITGYRVYRGTASGGETLLSSLGNVTSFNDSSLVNGTAYYYQVSSVNSVGEGSKSAERSVTPATTPGAATLNSVAGGNANVALAWSAPTNNGGSAITGYKVYRGTTPGSEILLTSLGNVTSYSDTSVSNNSTYYYQVSAVNSVGEGTKSNELLAKTADTQPPTISLTSPVNGSTVPASVPLSATASDNIAVTQVVFLVDNVALATDTTSPYTTTWDTTTVSNGSHVITATAYDAAGNSSSSSVSVTVQNGDTTPPSTPTGLAATAPAYNQVKLAWTASTDNVGVAGYYIVRNGTHIAQTAGIGTTYTDNTVSASTSYSYQVMAFDAKGNTSGLSNAASVTTPSVPDTTPPTNPLNLIATAVSSSQINLAWTKSTDNIGVKGYRVFRNGMLIATVTSNSFGDATVFASTKYNYAVKAFDAAGNVSNASTTTSATTLSSSKSAKLKGVTYYHTSTSTTNHILGSTTINLPYKGTNHYYTSNATTGAFNIIGIPPASYTVTFSKSGYQSKTLTMTLTASQIKTQNASLLKN